jgi:chemotaxis protein MotD
MMPGIAIHTGLSPAGASAARNVPPATDDRFSRALHDRPKPATPTDRKPDEDVKAGAADNSDGTHETSRRSNGNDDKVSQPAHAKDDGSDGSGEKKKKDDTDGSALPPHMMAERTLARQWSVAGQAAVATDGSAAAGVQAGNTDAAAPVIGSIQALPSADANGTARPGTALPVQGPVQGPIQGLPTPGGKGDAGTVPMQVNPAGDDPAPNSVSVIAATAAGAGKAVPDSTSAAFMAKVAASQNGGGPGGSQQGAASAASTSAPDAKPVASQIPQTIAGQGSGNTDADPDGQGGDGQSGKAAQNTAQPAAGTKGDTAATPLPTAQMVPSSGSATSFAGALQQGGALARYAAAAAALAAGTPANALPLQSLSIQLRPVELGSVTANLKYAGSGLTIDIQVETPEAHRRLSNDSSDIVKSLQSLGFQVDKVTVRQALAQPQTQGQAQGQVQGQAQGQAMARDGSAGGFANQGGSPFSMSGQSGGNGHRQGSEGGYENGSERGIGMVRETADRMSRRGVFI